MQHLFIIYASAASVLSICELLSIKPCETWSLIRWQIHLPGQHLASSSAGMNSGKLLTDKTSHGAPIWRATKNMATLVTAGTARDSWSVHLLLPWYHWESGTFCDCPATGQSCALTCLMHTVKWRLSVIWFYRWEKPGCGEEISDLYKNLRALWGGDVLLCKLSTWEAVVRGLQELEPNMGQI